MIQGSETPRTICGLRIVLRQSSRVTSLRSACPWVHDEPETLAHRLASVIPNCDISTMPCMRPVPCPPTLDLAANTNACRSDNLLGPTGGPALHKPAKGAPYAVSGTQAAHGRKL